MTSTKEIMKLYGYSKQYDTIEPWLKENGYTINDLPLTAMAETGEDVIIEHDGLDADENAIVWKLTYLQENGWARVNHLYKDGTVEESYHR